MYMYMYMYMYALRQTGLVCACIYIIKATISSCLRVTECGLEQWDVLEQ